MTLKDKLQIYLITYNRKQKLKETFEQIFADNSPIKDYDITILDNASTDGTSELIEEYCKRFPNIVHHRHSINIGGNPNICRAFEMATSCGKEYVWVLCDDDKYDFSNWEEVEEKINCNTDIICVSDYACNTSYKKLNPTYQIFQLTFVPAGIYKISNIDNNVMINMYDSIITMFQQACLSINAINENKSIQVLSKPIVFNGYLFDDRVENESLSYTRGSIKNNHIERRIQTNWILGFSQVLSLLNNKKLARECFNNAIKCLYSDKYTFYSDIIYKYFNSQNFNYFYEIFKILNCKQKIEITIFTILSLLVLFYQSPKGIYIRLFCRMKTKVWAFKSKN